MVFRCQLFLRGSMSKVLQVCLLVGSIFVLYVVIKSVLKNKINIHYAIVWIVWGIGMALISMFPRIIYKISDFMGIQIPVNAVFLMMMFFLYCLTFYVYFVISKHSEEIVALDYEIAMLKKKIEELEKNEK